MLQESSPRTTEVISFGPFRLIPSERLLKKEEEPVRLGSRAFDILRILIDHAGEVVGNKELVAKVWPDVFVEEVSLRVHVAALRKALGSAEMGPRYVANVPGRGYCFVAPISREWIETSAPEDRSFDPAYPLPPALARMVGRDEVVAEISRKLLADRFVTVVGPGGMGKTTVALSVAHALLQTFRGAVCFVDLGPLNDPNLLAGAVASTFGLPVRSQDPVPDIIAHLRGKPALLVLDSSEHLILEVVLLAERLSTQLDELHILATSREILRAEGENVFRLPPLDSPPDSPALTAAQMLEFPAAKLFMERAASGGAPILLDDADAPVVGKICRKLNGIALAIELAAGSVGTFSLYETEALLDSQFALRWPGRRAAPARHQTLNATLDWSYNLLSDIERVVLRRLSVFIGSYTLEAAQRVTANRDLSDEQVYDAIGGLFVKSLASGDTSLAIPRYRLLDTTRTYAAMKLAEAGEQKLLRRQHAEYYRKLLQKGTSNTDESTPEPRASAADLDDIRTALHWAFGTDGDTALGIDLAIGAVPIWLGKALFAECQDWMIKAAAAVPRGTPRDLSIQLALASTKIFTVGISDELTASWTTTLELAESLDDLACQLACFLPLWGSEIRAARYDDALKNASKCVEAAKKMPEPGPSATAEWMVGHSQHHLGRLAEARVHLQRGLAIDTDQARLAQTMAVGYDRKVDGLGLLASTLWLQGFPDQARQTALRAAATARPLPFALPISVAMTWLAYIDYLSSADIDAIEQDIVEMTEHARTHSIGSQVGVGLCILGLCQTRRHHFEAAVPLVSEGLRLLAEGRYEVYSPIILAHSCEGALVAGRQDDAQSLMAQLERRDRNPEHWCTAEILRVRGRLAQAAGDEAEAVDQFSKALNLARRQGALGWELRSATSLGQLWADQGRDKDALNLIEPVYGKFTEGFATVDLVAAERLIAGLRAPI
ncbi:helix-turn-helix transcriptional regulator [Sphingomonas sp. JC676]|uniref:ATP-binding protein n=1 Tax=Sphingomonas sp. JC676 TaxID=2768065 RepID=UPI001657AA53|nr:winged helix-turn-helix domain-containing protein [Sphingomonas sp. JC676]MBC9032640.1 helix-turn-helix transcriptional regulator [Sphingomonas sp. JC676]